MSGNTYVSPDTIAAIATPPGAGGIAVLRLSGSSARFVLRRLFLPSGGRDRFAFRPRYMHHGYALDTTGKRLDEVLAVFMPGPHSATGEDVGEIHCHGGRGVTTSLLEAALAAGARLAGPGEFTRRAFLNGRIDLTRAEAVAEMISASTREGVRLAGAKLDGHLARAVSGIRSSLDNLRVQLTLAVDFPDEEAELLSSEDCFAAVDHARRDIGRLLQAFDRARLWREGAVAVLAGRVNAGKSSLLNAFLGRDRAIVSDQPGTTRDYIEETVQVHGMPLRLVDTAGLREGGDIIEAEGMRRSQDLIAGADIVLLVADGPRDLSKAEWDFLGKSADLRAQGRLLLVYNKADRLLVGQADVLRGRHVPGYSGPVPLYAPPDAREQLHSCPAFVVSAVQGDGLDELAQGIAYIVSGGTMGCLPARNGGKAAEDSGDEANNASAPSSHNMESDIAPNLRQSDLLRQADAELAAFADDLRVPLPPDILAVRLDTAVRHLDEVTGTTSTDELLDRIFSSFCIGK